MRWIWDAEKDRLNRTKHGISFELAQLVFEDSLALTVADPHVGEERWRTIGTPSIESDVVLLVVHTWPEPDEAGDEVGRIISARKATRRERRHYEEGKF